MPSAFHRIHAMGSIILMPKKTRSPEAHSPFGTGTNPPFPAEPIHGVRWQVAPVNMEEPMKKPDVFKALMKQKKIIIADY